ncbi:hypothetical protein [Neobacillus driksii]|uniref:hypothetical protein n=1 Tax=Neobacillus driksii TaxID=3035913 RepID=UPI001C544783
MFSMWDAYKDADGGKESFSFLLFVFCLFYNSWSNLFPDIEDNGNTLLTGLVANVIFNYWVIY